jgi:hypothetical protein
MLSAAQTRGTLRRRRSPYSDKQHYQEYILQRIEGYKNSIPRDELLRLGDEAATELQATREGQFVLTEVLMLESVDRLIMKRLALRPYRRWRQQFLKLREAQRTPTHWGLEPSSALARLLPRVEPEDLALVVGSAAEPTVYLLAAYDAAVTFVAGDLGCVERVESRMASEALASLFDGFVVQLGVALPDFVSVEKADLVVVDPGALADLPLGCRQELVSDLQQRCRPGGVHVILPTCPALAPDALRSMYDGWAVEEDPKRRRRSGGGRRPDGLVLAKPAACPADTARQANAGS